MQSNPCKRILDSIVTVRSVTNGLVEYDLISKLPRFVDGGKPTAGERLIAFETICNHDDIANEIRLAIAQLGCLGEYVPAPIKYLDGWDYLDGVWPVRVEESCNSHIYMTRIISRDKAKRIESTEQREGEAVNRTKEKHAIYKGYAVKSHDIEEDLKRDVDDAKAALWIQIESVKDPRQRTLFDQ